MMNANILSSPRGAASVLAAIGVTMLACGIAQAAPKTLPNGDRVQYDGTYYDWRAADGKSGIKVWVPPAAKPVRGLMISGHGGGGGDSRVFARDANMKALAARFGFGLAGLWALPGGQVYANGAKRFFAALDEMAALGQHPELANVPFTIFGSSNGGAQAYGFANYAPQRAICFVSNVSSWMSPAPPAEAALAVPGIFVMGRFDPFNKEEEGVRKVADALAAARAKGARWALIVENKGHEDGVAMDVYAKLVEQCIALRCPADADPAKGPVALTTIPEDAGWLADPATCDSGLTVVAAWKDYKGDAKQANWLASQDLAYVFRGGATRNNPIAVGVQEVDRVYNPHTDPRTMFSVGGPIVEPGRALKLVCDVRDLPDWAKIEFYDGARKLGEVAAPADPVLPVTIGKTPAVWCLTALATTRSGSVRTSAPFYFTVKDPAVELLSQAEKAPRPAWQDAVGLVGSKTAQAAPADYKPKAGAVEKNVLLAYGLTAEQEKSFAAAAPGAASAFWRAIDAAHDAISMTQATHAREGSKFSIVTSMDARLKIKAAHSARGLYLYFEVIDNNFMNADPDRYIDTDALDVLLDSKSSAYINDPASFTQYVNWGLLLSTRQYQVAFGGDAPPAFMKRNFSDLWDMTYNSITFADAAKYHGMQVRFVKLDRLTRAQEWFIPWSEMGHPGDIAAEPAVGTRLAFAPGYNDRDAGEEAAKQLRWIDHSTPWAHGAAGGTPPRAWGDIEIGPMIAPTGGK